MKLQFTNAFFGQLPLMVISAIAWAAPLLILAADVHPQVCNVVVLAIPVAVVNSFPCEQGSSKVLGHHKAVLKYGRIRWRTHGAKQRQVIIRNKRNTQIDIARGGSGEGSSGRPMIIVY